MSSPEQNNTDPSKVDEIPLEDIDKLLEAEDPEFSKELEAVKAVENDTAVSIEATVVASDDLGGDEKAANETRLQKLRARIRMSLYTLKQNTKARIKAFGQAAWIFLKTKPKQYALKTIAFAKLAATKAVIPVRLFKEASNTQRLTALIVTAMVGLSLWVLVNNLRGVWIPLLNEPILASFEEHAEWTEEFDTKDGTEAFYSAFPQEIHEFLFGRMKVNLRPGPDSPNPMGAFEVIVQVDSKDTAIELRDREVELFDGLQRVFEEETFNDLESDLGKGKLKGRIKRELNQKLTQGWIKDVKFKTFILKP